MLGVSLRFRFVPLCFVLLCTEQRWFVPTHSYSVLFYQFTKRLFMFTNRFNYTSSEINALNFCWHMHKLNGLQKETYIIITTVIISLKKTICILMWLAKEFDCHIYNYSNKFKMKRGTRRKYEIYIKLETFWSYVAAAS